MAKRRATNKSANKKPRMDVPLDPDDPVFGRSFNTKTGKFSDAVTAKSLQAAERAEANRLLIRTGQFVKGGKSVSPSVRGAKEVLVKGKEVNVPVKNTKGQTYGSVKQIAPVKDPFGGVQAVTKTTKSLSGRTVEYGTRSMLQGLRNWITGGGGSRLLGK